MSKAFTIIEIMIVVIILGIIAAVVLPRFSNASDTARASMLADNLRIIRMQLEVFKGQHLGVPAGYPDLQTTQTPTEEAFVMHMTKPSNSAGEADSGKLYGPYLREIPVNPLNGKNTLEVLDSDTPFPKSADDSHGWIYNPSTQEFRADSPGADDKGKAYFDY